ncbi:MAG: 4Fe-4S binding protein [Sedimentisphaerales bacterium]|nr:4Fe-4S binding protein [Sedimentisphaerales bacterium]
MKITTTRRISQVFFITLFVWLCMVSTVGDKFQQIRNWPVNLFLNLDPLVAIGTILTTQTLYAGLAIAIVTVILTIIFGRFFCGWICPFGTIHHFFGWLGKIGKKTPAKIKLNTYRKAQCVKYYILVFFLIMAAFPSLAATLQTGLLDPIPLVTRSFNLVILSIADKAFNPDFSGSTTARLYEGAWLVFTVFAVFVLLNIYIPRFFCRFICPAGAMFGLLDRFAIWRIGKRQADCINCRLCEVNCEGGCEPPGNFRISECVLCFNCLSDCSHDLMTYQTKKSAAGEITNPDISRRGFVLSLASGTLVLPAVRLGAKIGKNYNPSIIRPPGALAEEEFLKRCLKCGQCMRVCPTNVIQPGGLEGGLENLWTPVLNNRIGSSGCQYNCVACGQICPTAAIKPITLEEKHGQGQFAEAGPIKLGTAFVDTTRCLPWAFGKPCIVCQENCPVSPKAIFTKETFQTVRDGIMRIKNISNNTIEIHQSSMVFGEFATGDYFLEIPEKGRKKITANTRSSVTIDTEQIDWPNVEEGTEIKIQVRLQRPYVDLEKCIGCGVCEHECPVSGKRAIRVSAEGESRSRDRKLLL